MNCCTWHLRIGNQTASELLLKLPEVRRLAKEIDESQRIEANSSSMRGISLMILGGFITAVGIAVVALTFTVLNVATLGIGLFASLGVVTALAGLGFFATGAYINGHSINNQSLEVQYNLAL